jgi:uncharacterized protein (DUF58 family)
MIVPQTKLLFWFAGVVLPFSALGALYAEALWVALLLILGLLLLAVIDALRSVGRLNDLRTKLPALLRLSLDRTVAVDLTVENPARTARILRLALDLPPGLQPEREEIWTQLPADTEFAQVPWRIHPVSRGRFGIERVLIEEPSPWGFWGVRRTTPVCCEVRVYPNLRRERKELAALFLHRGALGLHAQRQMGKGRDFEKLREYVSGDSYDEIHWKATAKRHHPVTKVFQIERTQEIYIVIDASRLSNQPVSTVSTLEPVQSRSFGGTGSPRDEGGDESVAFANERPDGANRALERFISAALILAQAAEQQGDLFGLVTFTEQVGTFLRARNGHAHYAACRDALFTLTAENVTPDFDEIISFLRSRLRRRALLVFLTSLQDPMGAESFTRNASLLARQHLILANMIQPPGVHPLFTQSADLHDLDDLYRHLGGHLQWQRLQELQRVLQHRGVRFSLVDHERLATDLVSQYLGIKQRQLL